LTLSPGTHLDPFFRDVQFSFFVFCPPVADCRQDEPLALRRTIRFPPSIIWPRISIPLELRCRTSPPLRYPEMARARRKPISAVMLMEALSAVGDDLSYLQDEGHSKRYPDRHRATFVVPLARMVDYEASPVMSATRWSASP